MTDSERYNKALEYLRNEGIAYTGREVAARMHSIPANISRMRRGETTSKFLVRFNDAFSNIFSLEWLLHGKGEMLASQNHPSPPIPTPNRVYLIPATAWGRSLADYTPQILERDCKKIENPCVGAELAIQVYGESMAPSYPPGSIIFVKKVNQEMFIEWGRVYLLDTRNGSVLKRIVPAQSEDSIICESLNPDYASFTILTTYILNMYKVLGCLTFE